LRVRITTEYILVYRVRCQVGWISGSNMSVAGSSGAS